MAPRALFLPLAASHGTNHANNRAPEIGQDILPRNTLDEVSFFDHNETDKDREALNEEEDIDVEEDGIGDSMDPKISQPRRRLSSATSFTTFSKSLTSVEQPTWFRKVRYFVFPPRMDIESFIPHYRHTPIISGLLIPFSILLEIPGLTEHWYIRTENNQVVERRSNPILLDAGLGISLACAVIANICLITRFLEKRVKTMTVLCVIFLTIHELINVLAVTVFGIEHYFNDVFTHGQSFWMTVCSTIASSFTNATLIWDLHRTPDFNKSGSGLTRRQRSMVIIIMVLFCYICFGALIISLLQKLSFINSLYFTLVSIETIGFGDIVPKTTGSRVFVCIYSTIGVLNLGVAIGMCRETVLEAIEVACRKRAQKVKERWKQAKKWRQVEACWRRGIEWRLREMGAPIWIRDDNCHGHKAGGVGRSMERVTTRGQNRSGILSRAAEWVGLTERKIGRSHLIHGPTGMRLNLCALAQAQLEAAALEAGVPLDRLLPSDLIPAAEETSAYHTDADTGHNVLPGWTHHPLASHFEHMFHPTEARTLTHARLGGMSALLTRFAVAAVHRHATALDEVLDEDEPTNHNGNFTRDAVLSGTSYKTDTPPAAEEDKDPSHFDFSSVIAHSSYNLDLQTIKHLDTKAFYYKLITAWSLFFVFWIVGSAIFMTTEGWSYWTSMYFCFVAFTTIGYGDYYPATPAGRSVFVVWAILGVGTMTVLISVVQEAYGSRYKNAMHIRAFDKAVKRYRERIQNVKVITGRSGRRLHIHGHTLNRAVPPSHSQGQARSASRSPSVSNCQQAYTARQKTNLSASHTRAEDSLEALPNHVLCHAKTFRTYIRLFADDTNVFNAQIGGSARTIVSVGIDEVGSALRRLLDEIAALGGIGKATKDEILQDPDARHTLFVLCIEKALYKMIEAAEATIDAVQERDKLAAQVPRQPLNRNKPDPRGDNGASNVIPRRS